MSAKGPDPNLEDFHADGAETGGYDDDGMHPDEHAEAALGPIDWAAWGASLLGVGLGGVVCLCLFLVTHPV